MENWQLKIDAFKAWARHGSIGIDRTFIFTVEAKKLESGPRPSRGGHFPGEHGRILVDNLLDTIYQSASVQLDFDVQLDIPIEIDGDRIESPHAHIDDGGNEFVIARRVSLRVHDFQNQNIILRNLSIQSVNINGHASCRLEIRDSDIHTLDVGGSNPNVSLDISNCRIGHLKFGPNCCRNFHLSASSVFDLDCPPPGSESPFTGSVEFQNVDFTRKSEEGLLAGPQPYRNLRHHLRALENDQAASIVHAAEQAVERETDSWPGRYLSHLYEFGSDFGASFGRPLFWLLYLWVFMISIILIADGPIGALPKSDFIGWRAILVEPDIGGQIARAALLSMQPITNPLGVFGFKALMLAKYGWLNFVLLLDGIISAALLALFFLAARRRFKMAA